MRINQHLWNHKKDFDLYNTFSNHLLHFLKYILLLFCTYIGIFLSDVFITKKHLAWFPLVAYIFQLTHNDSFGLGLWYFLIQKPFSSTVLDTFTKETKIVATSGTTFKYNRISANKQSEHSVYMCKYFCPDAS